MEVARPHTRNHTVYMGEGDGDAKCPLGLGRGLDGSGTARLLGRESLAGALGTEDGRGTGNGSCDGRQVDRRQSVSQSPIRPENDSTLGDPKRSKQPASRASTSTDFLSYRPSETGIEWRSSMSDERLRMTDVQVENPEHQPKRNASLFCAGNSLI